MVNGKRGKMCSITTKSSRSGKTTLNAKLILFGGYMKIEDLDYQMFGNLGSEEWPQIILGICVNKWLATSCTSSHTLPQRMESDHTENENDSLKMRSWHRQSPKCHHAPLLLWCFEKNTLNSLNTRLLKNLTFKWWCKSCNKFLPP